MVDPSSSTSSLPHPLSPSSHPSSSRASSPSVPVIQPDHFYGSDGSQLPPSPLSEGKAWLDPDDDPLAARGIPVFKPSMADFQDFEGYMKRIECWGRRSGIVKVIPPKVWKDALPSVTDKLANIKLHHPIEQHMIGRAGLFRQKNMETFRIFSVREWAELCNKDAYRAPGVDDLGLHSSALPGSTARLSRSRKKTKGRSSATEQPASITSPPSPISMPGTPLSQLEPESSSEVAKREDNEANLSIDAPGSEVHSSNPQSRRASKSARVAARAAKDAAFMEDFDPDSDWLPPNTTPFDYTPEFCRQLERKFWRTCSMGTPAQYGADMAGSLFEDADMPWNVACLPSTLERIMPRMKHPTPGVNLPYLYFGMWRATFAWHVEDCDLFSINYIHFGAGKFWYAIPQARANAFEMVMRGYFPEGPNTCSQFLRHKAFLASPTILAQANCRPNTLVQNAGEFVITYPRGYHAGFNLGLNCAESTNFALESWLDLGRKAKYCACVGDSVRIDIDALLYEREEEYASQGRGDNPARFDELGTRSPVARLAEAQVEFSSPYDPVSSVASTSSTSPHSAPLSSRKRKRKPDSLGSTLKPAKAKKPKIKSLPPQAVSSSSALFSPSSSSSVSPTTAKVVLKLGPRPPDDLGFPCVLCVSTSHEGLLPVHTRPRSAHAAFASIAKGPWMAHELCARIIPETWVEETEGVDSDGTRTRSVFGVDSILKDRLNLRCAACSKMRAKMHGAPVQCTKGKCPKAFHVSCARESDDIIFRELETQAETTTHDLMKLPAPADEIDTSTEVGFELLCAQHNPTILQARKASKEGRVRQDLHALPPGARIKIRGHSGVFEVSLVSIDDTARTVNVIWDLGVQRTFRWSNIMVGEGDVVDYSSVPVCVQTEPVSADPTQHATSSKHMDSSGLGAKSEL